MVNALHSYPLESSMKALETTINEYYKNLPVLVTGGCGFIGSHIVQTLVCMGARVTILDDLSTGSLDNIASVHTNVLFIKGSVNDLKTCMQACDGQAAVFHLAAFISVPGSIENPQSCFDTNVLGTAHMLEAARIHGVQRFVFSSSAAVYGAIEGTCAESMPCTPTSPYGYSKWMGELLCEQYRNVFNISTVCLRYFNVHGERQNPHGQYAAVRACFEHRLATNQPITIFGDGLQTRDFVSVAQVVQANLVAGMCKREMLSYTIFNVATGKSISLLGLIDELKRKHPHYTGSIHHAQERAGDVRNSAADCSRFTQLTISLINHAQPSKTYVREGAQQ